MINAERSLQWAQNAVEKKKVSMSSLALQYFSTLTATASASFLDTILQTIAALQMQLVEQKERTLSLYQLPADLHCNGAVSHPPTHSYIQTY